MKKRAEKWAGEEKIEHKIEKKERGGEVKRERESKLSIEYRRHKFSTLSHKEKESMNWKQEFQFLDRS